MNNATFYPVITSNTLAHTRTHTLTHPYTISSNIHPTCTHIKSILTTVFMYIHTHSHIIGMYLKDVRIQVNTTSQCTVNDVYV